MLGQYYRHRSVVSRGGEPVALWVAPTGRWLSRTIEAPWAGIFWLPVAVLSMALAYLTAIQIRWAIAFLGWPTEIMYGESLIYDHAARLLRGEALYQPLGEPSYSIASYTPVFYLVIALVEDVFGPTLFLGRLISVVATLVTVLMLVRLAGRERSILIGSLAGLLYVALGFPTPFPWFALAKEDCLAVAFAVGSMAVLSAGTGTRRVVAAAVLAALAVLTKQTFVAATLAGALALAIYDTRKSLIFSCVALGIAVTVAIGFELSTHAFVLNTIGASVQEFRSDVLFTNLATLKAYQAGPLAIAAFSVARRLWRRRGFADLLLGLYWCATLLPLVGLASVGSAQNYWIELAASTAVVATQEVALWLSTPRLWQRAMGVGLALLPFVNVVVAGQLAISWLPHVNRYSDPSRVASEFMELVAYVRDSPDDVLAEPLDVTALAFKPTLVEPWASDVMYQTGRWDFTPLVGRICGGRIRMAILGHRMESYGPAYHNYTTWPDPVLTAMRRAMVLQEQRAGRYVYVSRPHPSCADPINARSPRLV